MTLNKCYCLIIKAKYEHLGKEQEKMFLKKVLSKIPVTVKY